MDERKIKRHSEARRDGVTVALAVSAFLIGGELLTVGRESAAEANASGIAFALSLFALGAAASAADAVFKTGSSKGAREIAAWIFGIFAAAASLFVLIDTAMDFSTFAADVMLLRAPRLPVALIFLAFCVYLASRGAKAVQKFALLSVAVLFLGAITTMILALPSLDATHFSVPMGSVDLGYTVVAFVKKFAPICVALIYFACRPSESRGERYEANITPRDAFFGVLIGGAILTLCHLNVTLLLGNTLAQKQSIPYSAAASAVSAGKLFMRAEGLSYVMYFLAASVRASIAIGTIISLSKRFLVLKRP